MMDDWAEAQAYTCMKESSFSKKRWQTILQLVSPLPSATIQDRFVTRPFSRNSSSRNGGRCRQFLIVLKGAGWPGWEEPDLETPWIQSKGFCQLHSFPVTHTSLQVSKTDAAASSEYYLEFACWASSGVCSLFSFAAWCCQDTKSSREKKEGPFRSLTRPMSLVVRAAITSNVTAVAAGIRW